MQAGEIANMGRIPVEFRRSGPDKFWQFVSTTRIEEIRSALEEACFGGTFSINAQRMVKGSPHHKGVRFGSPTRYGLELTVQDGDNGSRVQLLICTPHGIDPYHFHTRVKEAWLRCEDTPNCANNIGEVVAPLATDTAAAPKTRVEEPARYVEAAKSSDTETVPARKQSWKEFFNDPDSMQLLFGLIKDCAQEGFVTAHNLSQLLMSELGIRAGKQLAPVYRMLITRKVLEPAGSRTYRVVGAYEPAVPATPALDTEGEAAQKSVGLADQVKHVMERAKQLVIHSSRLSVIRGEVASLQSKLETLLAEMRELESRLHTTENQEVLRQYTELQKLFGKS